MNSLKKELLQMTHAAPTNITLSAIAGIYILAQVIIVPALPDLGIVFSSDYRTCLLYTSDAADES